MQPKQDQDSRGSHFILTPVGSSGDVHPFLGIGRELLSRGYDVTLITGEPFRKVAEDLGIPFVCSWDQESYEAVTRDPRLWKTTRGLQLVLSTAASGLEASYDLISQHYQPGRSVLVGHTLSFATRVFEEKHNAAAATIHLAPSAFRSNYAQPAVPPGFDISGLPGWTKRAMWKMLDRWIIDPSSAPALNRLRARLGLEPVYRIFKDYLHSPRQVIGIFPEWFANRQPDWPPQLQLTSFPLYDEADLYVLPPDLENFLSSGDAPVAITAGTGNRQARKFFEKMLDAVKRSQRRALLLTPFAEQIPSGLPPEIMHVPYAPFSSLLTRCKAIIHHGGIGTTAQGLAAGIPQLIHPLNFDQPDNAMRARNLGVARIIMPWHTSNTIAHIIREWVDSPEAAAICGRLASELRRTNGIAWTCDILEKIST